MNLISLVITLLIIGAILYVIQRLPGIDSTIKTIIYFVVILVVLIWLLQGLVPGLGTIRIP